MAKLSHLEKEYIKANHKNKTAEELSKPGNSFNYEFVCDVGSRVPRKYA